MQINNTISYYNQNAGSFSSETKDVEFHQTQDKFLNKLPKGSSILDFGCGSGRDTKYFCDRGYQVDAIDGSEELCKIATDLAGIPIKCMLFQDLSETAKYQGIWACSSILHLSQTELHEVFQKMIIALKSEGYLYTSFKYGELSGMRNGRFFTDMTEELFNDFIQEHSELSLEEMWVSTDVRPGRGEEKWLNLILKKTNF